MSQFHQPIENPCSRRSEILNEERKKERKKKREREKIEVNTKKYLKREG
jgi:hypothetical protein